ncbi:MAG: amino acid racemase [Oscillospiraceae bacterium]|nr:amino acid racemase [Oscillospiraceae bacterium]
MKKKLGIIGGMGPLATVYFMELIISNTAAKSDSDHIEMIVYNIPSIPDRTEFILGRSNLDPLPIIADTAMRLERAGVDLIAIPCVTAHCFYDRLCQYVAVPVVNMVELTADELVRDGMKKAGVMATSGTLSTQLFQKALEERGILCITPDQPNQDRVMSIIYNDIKAGKPADMNEFERVSRHLFSAGCDKIILGCTELPLIKKHTNLDSRQYADVLEITAKAMQN